MSDDIKKRDDLIESLFEQILSLRDEDPDFDYDEFDSRVDEWRKWRGEAGMDHWEWWTKELDDEVYGLSCEADRDAAISSARREIGHNATIEIIEARSWNDLAKGEEEYVPFAQTRNHAVLRGSAND